MDTVRIFDTTLRDGEQSPGGDADAPGKAGDRPAPRGDGRGHHRGRASRSAPTATSNRSRRSRPRSREHRLRPGPLHAQGHRAGPAKRSSTPSAAASTSSAPPARSTASTSCARGRRRSSSCPSTRSSRRWSTPTTSSSRPEDASRTELEFLEEIVQAAIEAGATTINLPDTVGYATPKGYGEIFAHLLEKLPILREKGIILSSHCHDDLGMARRQQPVGGRERRAAGRVHDQRHRRARGQRGAGRDRHGPADPRATSTRSARASTRPRSIPPAGWSAR